MSAKLDTIVGEGICLRTNEICSRLSLTALVSNHNHSVTEGNFTR